MQIVTKMEIVIPLLTKVSIFSEGLIYTSTMDKNIEMPIK